MTTVTLPAYGWTPRDYQRPAWAALRDPSIRTHVLAWARRHGKDEIAMHGTAIKALERVGNYYHALPKYSQARKAIWDARNPHTGRVRWKEAFPEEIIKHVDNQTMMLTLVNGSTWQLIGSDNIDSLMGTTPAGVAFSEAALADPTTFGFFRPILLENNGWSLHVSSTRGKNHFHELFQAMSTEPTAFTSHISARDTSVFTQAQLAEELRVYVRLYGEALGRSLFEQEFLSNWDAAVVGAVWGQELRQLEEAGRVTPIGHDPRYPVETSWDLGIGDPTVILFWQTIGAQPRLIDWYMSTDAGLEHFAEVIHAKPYHYAKRGHKWPHDGAHREFGSGTSRKSQAKRLGLDVQVMPNVPKHDSLAAGSQLIKGMWVNADPENPPNDRQDDCLAVLEAIKQYRFKFSEEHKVLSSKPVHDWTSHYADALCCYAISRTGDISVHTPTIRPKENHEMDNVRIRSLMAARSHHGAWG